jgi:CrcB protein
MLVLKQILIVAVGGAVGSVARYKIGGFALHHTQAWDFPLSTFCVNALGCFFIGVLAALVEHHDLFSSSTRLFLFTGLLGGFTTFSAFGYESAFLKARSAASNDRIHIAQYSVRTWCRIRWNEAGGSLLATAPLTPGLTRKPGDLFLPAANWKPRG